MENGAFDSKRIMPICLPEDAKFKVKYKNELIPFLNICFEIMYSFLMAKLTFPS